MRGNSEIVLASASPRRQELLELAGVGFAVVPSDAPEDLLPGEEPAAHAARLAADKARDSAGKCPTGRYFIGADTIVVCDSEIMGKPRDAADAERMLRRLSGRAHEVLTGYAIYDRREDRLLVDTVATTVIFKDLDDREIFDYIATGCPMDKAGAYAIQGGAAHMVRKIDGSYTNVVGLPLCEVVESLKLIGAL